MSNGTDLGLGTKKQGGFGFQKQAKIIEQTRKFNVQVALTLHGFTLHVPHFTRGYLEVIEIDQECEYRTCANRTAPF